MSYRKIGDLIQLVDVRNKDLSITHLVGLTINKKFIPSVANTIGTDMSNYKIIRKNQFACSTMQVRRDKKMPVALLKELDVAIISQAYPVFEVIDEKELLPEYLMLWFTRSEFDREACFHAVGGVRGSLEWEDFCNMELPVPSIEKQREIVAQYQAVASKIKVNEQICEKLEATAQTLYKQWFIDFEFPVTDTEALEVSDDVASRASATVGYKSSGGAMVFNEELEKEIPEGWEVGKLEYYTEFKNGYAFKSDWWETQGLPVIKIGSIQNGIIQSNELGYISQVNKPKNTNTAKSGDIVIAMTGATVGKIGIVIGNYEEYYINQRVGIFSFRNEYYKSYIYIYLKQDLFNYEIQNIGGDSAQANVSDKQILNITLLIPGNYIVEKFNEKFQPEYNLIISLNNQNQKLTLLQSLLLSRLARLEG